MAITHMAGSNIFQMTAAGDEITDALWVTGIRVTSDAATIDDRIDLVDPSATGNELWRTITAATDYVEEVTFNPPRLWRNGVRVHVNEGDRAEIYISYN